MRLLPILAVLLIGSAASAQVSFTVSSFTPDIYGLGTATLTWSAPSATTIQIRADSVTGPELLQSDNGEIPGPDDVCFSQPA
jgi:hypothetical protein